MGKFLIYMYQLSEELRLGDMHGEEEHKLWVEKQRLAEERKRDLKMKKKYWGSSKSGKRLWDGLQRLEHI